MFRFTIRDLLWLMVVVGLALALLSARYELSKALPWRERAAALEAALTDEEDVDVSYNGGCVVVWGHPNGVTHHVRRYELKGYEPSEELTRCGR
jgi:hypothetical protein